MFVEVRSRVVPAAVLFWPACLLFAALAVPSFAQPVDTGAAAAFNSAISIEALPDAPVPQEMIASIDPSALQQPLQSQPGQPTSSSSSDAAPAQPEEVQEKEEKHAEAEEQLKEQEHQRVLGVMASFNTTSNRDALPLSSGQKFSLFIKSATDPWPFGLSAVVAGIGQADDSYPEWGQGIKGYATRFGGAYGDYFIGNFFGNALYPSILHEDPRYFQKGSGRAITRILWAASSTIWCKRDNGTWGPNYANVMGNLTGSAIARLYYPANERTVSDTITDGFTVSAEGIVGAEVIEFWPDMVRHHRRKQAEKQAAIDAAPDQKKSAKP